MTLVEEIADILNTVGDLLIEKNKAYGNSFAEPANIFSSSSAMEQLGVRIDDKLARVQRGHEYPGDDTIIDLLGYLVLLYILRKRQEKAEQESL